MSDFDYLARRAHEAELLKELLENVDNPTEEFKQFVDGHAFVTEAQIEQYSIEHPQRVISESEVQA
jgi:hypothetical protein